MKAWGPEPGRWTWLGQPSPGKNIQFWEESCQKAACSEETIQKSGKLKAKFMTNNFMNWTCLAWSRDDSEGDGSQTRLQSTAGGDFRSLSLLPLQNSFHCRQLGLQCVCIPSEFPFSLPLVTLLTFPFLQTYGLTISSLVFTYDFVFFSEKIATSKKKFLCNIN